MRTILLFAFALFFAGHAAAQIVGGGSSSLIIIGSTTLSSGADTRVMFQDGASPSGVFQESPFFTFNKTTGALALSGGAAGAGTQLLVNPATISGTGVLLDLQIAGVSTMNVINDGVGDVTLSLTASSSDFRGSADLYFTTVGASNNLTFRNLSNGWGFGFKVDGGTNISAFRTAIQVGGTTLFTMSEGEFGQVKISPSGTAPGAGRAKMDWVAGTNAGTCKLIAYAGTSTTPATIIDNVGGGC